MKEDVLKMLKLVFCLAFAGGSTFLGAADPEMARVQKIDIRTISVGDETVDLDAAYCFQVWNGPRPDYPPSEDANLANLRAYLQQQGDVARLSHLDWIVDFVIRFDNDVDAGNVALYGQLDPLFPDWVDFNEISSIPSLAANEEFRLLNVDFITYGKALEMLENFNCGASSRLYGTTLTVDLRLYDPTGESEPLTIATCQHTFALTNQGNWFDAHVSDYFFWPEDAHWAFGGFWQTSVPLEQAASVMRIGELDVCTKDGLVFMADEARAPGSNPEETVIETKVLMEEYPTVDLPPVAPSYKGGVLLASEGGSRCFYGLARVGEKNGWVKLDGPVAESDCDSVCLKMTFRKDAGDTLVKYVIDGVECKYAGRVEIPVVTEGAVKGVRYIGGGMVYSLFGSTPRPKRGMVLSLR